MSCIYKITNLITKKIYIGQTNGNKPSYFGSGKIFIRTLRKWGKNRY